MTAPKYFGNVIGDGQPWFDVTYFGAVGDNVTDNTTAFQNAINAASVAGGIVWVPVGRYKILGALSNTVGHCVTIQGQSIGLSPYDYGSGGPFGAQLIGANGVNLLTVSNVGYFTIRDIGIQIPAGATSACVGINLQSCYLPKVLNCRITNYSTGILLQNNTDIYIERTLTLSTGVTVSPVIGIDINGTNHLQNASVYISHCISAHGTYSGGAYGYYLHGNRINDLYMDMCEADGCTRCYYIDGSTVDAGFGGDIHFRGCSADAVALTGLGYYIHGLATDSSAEISHGWSAGGADTHILVDSSSKNILVNSMQIQGGANGISIAGGQATVVNNQLLYQTANAILVSAAPGSLVANNTGFQKSATSASFINLTGASNHVSVMGNSARSTVSGGWTNGIVADATTTDYNNYIGNVIDPAGTTTPYTLNLGTNTHSVQLGTTA